MDYAVYTWDMDVLLGYKMILLIFSYLIVLFYFLCLNYANIDELLTDIICS